jgi:hypothetical protein
MSEPVLGTVGKKDKRRLEVLGIAASLFLRVGGVPVSTLRFKHTDNVAILIAEQIIRPSTDRPVLKLDLFWLRETPSTGFQGLVDENTGSGFGL